MNEEVMTHVGPQRHKEQEYISLFHTDITNTWLISLPERDTIIMHRTAHEMTKQQVTS